MRVIVWLVWWNLRGRRARIALLIACLALAVAGRVAVGSLVAGVEMVAAREARGLLGGDLELASARPLTSEQLAAVTAVIPAGSTHLPVQGLVTMAAYGGAARPVELRAVPPGYPLVGRIDATEPVTVLHAGAQALVQTELLERLSVTIGDTVTLGDVSVRIAGILRDEPGLSASPFAAGPRVLISSATLEASGLAAYGARIRHQTLIAVPDSTQATAIAKQVNQALGNPADAAPPPGSMGPPIAGVTVRTAQDAQAQAARFLERFADYVRLTALVALLLGGVGVASLVRGQVVESLDDVAMWRVLGATPRQVQGIFLVQAGLLGVVGGVFGAACGAGAAWLIAVALPAWGLIPGWDVGVIAGGIALGCGTAVLFAWLPLAELQAVSPAAILRREHLAAGWRPAGSRTVLVALAAIGGGLVLLAAWDSRSWVVGPAFMATVLVAAGILQLIGHLALPQIARLRPPYPWLALAVGNLGRPGYRPVAAATAIGLAAFLGGALLIYRASLLAELDPTRRGGMPGLFVIDLQPDQVPTFRDLLRERDITEGSELAPVVRARYREPKRVVPTGTTREAEQERFFRNREQNLSFRPTLGTGNTIIAGTWMDPAGTQVEASLEVRFAARLGVKLGDPITFDVQGVPVTATITSLRQVDWSSFRPNFFVLLSPAALADAPQTWIASLPTLPDAERRALQAAVAERCPGASAYDVSEIVRKVLGLIGRLMWTIRAIALLALAAGLAVLIGMALATAASRRQDAALLIVLGARRRTLAAAVAAEFALIGLFAGSLGAILAVGGAWVVVGQVIGLDLSVPWLWLMGFVVALAAICVAVGAAACRQVWQVSPLAVLRE